MRKLGGSGRQATAVHDFASEREIYRMPTCAETELDLLLWVTSIA